MDWMTGAQFLAHPEGSVAHSVSYPVDAKAYFHGGRAVRV
jgi:hypothetical protein